MVRGDRKAFLRTTRQRIEDLERLIRADLEEPQLERDAGWDAESLRQDAARGTFPASR